MTTTVDEQQLKSILKEALVEIFEERRDLLHDALAEALEDITLVHAIREGLESEPISRSDIFGVLEGAA